VEGVTVQLIHKSEFDGDIKGYEDHPEELIGSIGYFSEKDYSEVYTVHKMAIPDCYEIIGKGYIRVPDLKTSVYLRSKGDTFTCRCAKHSDEFWTVLENIPDVE